MTSRTLHQPMLQQAKSHAASWCTVQRSVVEKRSYLGLDLTPSTASVVAIRFANPEAGT